jgi:hypothetical protein
MYLQPFLVKKLISVVFPPVFQAEN